MDRTDRQNWDLILKPKTGWFDIQVGDFWRYHNLIFLFVKRDFVTLYKQTILGPLWYIIQPLFSTIVFTVIFGKIAKIPTDGIPPFLFYLSGNVVWGYFAHCLTGTSNTFISNANIFGKVYFPRLTVPASVVIAAVLPLNYRPAVSNRERLRKMRLDVNCSKRPVIQARNPFSSANGGST